MKPILRLALALASASRSAVAAEIHLAQGALAGEVTATSVILQTRLTAAPGLVESDVPGAPGVGRFEISTARDFKKSTQTGWLQAVPERDYILKTTVTGLSPGTRYHFRPVYGASEAAAKPGPAGTFKTHPLPAAAAGVNFILTSCMNYAFFHFGQQARGTGVYTGPDKHLGYPALEPILKLKPDFVVFDGDCVYYDHPAVGRAETQSELRRKWHEQHVQPRFVQLFARTATYWLKDDHDYRKNDSDPTGDYAPSHELGIYTFREQIPIVDLDDPKAVTYRTHRIGRDLQIWMVEGRDYRSPNKMPDGPDKTIWGAEQRAWLQRTILASDATFKILISPTPMVGPDDATKTDNHVNRKGFRHEGESFLAWLKQNNIPTDRFFILTGDRHWKFHSVHPTGYQEFSCGALNRENSRLGRAPGDPKSTDPDAEVKQLYTDATPSGGFLRVHVQPATSSRPARAEFIHHRDDGEVLYRYRADGPGAK